MAFCLIKPLAEKFKKAIKTGEINIEKLSSMTSDERRLFFKNLTDERNAKEINALFESKLLLKNKERGLVNWAKQITGLKPGVKNELVDKAQRLTEQGILTPEAEEMFLKDLASKRLGTDISIKEANKIVDLSKKVEELSSYADEASRIKYGRAKVELAEYINSLNPKQAGIVKNVIGLPRAVLASLDLSAPLNQGWGMLSRKQWYKNLGPMLKAFADENAYKDIKADIITRPNYKAAKKAGLRLTEIGQTLENKEEEFMTTLLDKVPGFAGSQRAYTAFLNKLRMDVFDDIVNKMALAGEDVGVGSPALEDIAKSVNMFTGGYGKTSAELNAMFFSPRKIQSTLQVLNPINYVNPKISPTVRKENIRNLIGSLAITGTILKTADMLGGDMIEMETDPRSSDFGKIRIGNVRLDISGGNAGYATLLSRIIPGFWGKGAIKSSTTGVITPLGTKPGQTSATSSVGRFGRNKLSPIASLIVDAFYGENAIGEKKTIPQSVIDRFKPMFLNSAYELIKEDPKFASLIPVALFGAGVNVYSASENWQDKETEEMKQFKEKVGDDKFNKANEKYNSIIDKEIKAFRKSDEYKNMSEEDKADKVDDIKTNAKKSVFSEYGFKKVNLPKKK